MIVPFQGYVVGLTNKPESVDKKTGEAIPAQHNIQLLIREADGMIVKNVRCSRAFQARYEAAVLRPDAPPKPVTLQVDLNMWEMNGRSGLSLKAVEEK